MAKKKKQISKQEKSLRNKIYYLNSKNKKLKERIELFDEDKFYSLKSLKVSDNFKKHNFKQKGKIKGSTLKNILKNKIKDNNNEQNKTFRTLKNKFKKDLKNTKKQVRTKKKGVFTSVPYMAWELNLALAWIEEKANNDKNLSDYLIETNETFYLMGNYDNAQLVYNRNNKTFEVFIIENDN